MGDFGFASLFLNLIIWAFTLLFLSVLCYRIYKVFIKRSERYSIRRVEGNWFLKSFKILFGCSMLLLMISVPFYAFIATALKSFVPAYLKNLAVATILTVAGLECYLSLSMSQKLMTKTYKKVALVVVTLVMLVFSAYRVWSIPDMFVYPAEKECYMIDLPIKGTWLAAHAGGSVIVNYHYAVKSQQYAVDIEKLGADGQVFKNYGADVKDFYTFNEPIYAPVDGTVVNVVDGLENAPVSVTTNDRKNPAGNHVVIKFKDDRYIFLAHLNKGSIRVKKGDIVRSGDLVGLAGNSGNTSNPHLHMHIQDMPTIDRKATSYPFRFKHMKRKRWMSWAKVENDYIIRNDLFSNE